MKNRTQSVSNTFLLNFKVTPEQCRRYQVKARRLAHGNLSALIRDALERYSGV